MDLRLVLTRDREEIQGLFDTQIEGIMELIKEQLDWMKNNNIAEQVVSKKLKDQEAEHDYSLIHNLRST